MRWITICFLLLVAVVSVSPAVPASATEKQFVSIGTGGVTGVYYPAGAAICRLVNQRRSEYGLYCAVESTSGSVYTLRAIAAGKLEMGIVQSDWQYHAYQGDGPFAGQGANKDLRTVFALHSEPFSVVVRSDSGVDNFAGLKGKRINVGNPGSGQRATMEVVMDAFGWTKEDFSLVTELSSAEQSEALCSNRIDGMIFTAGHPSGSIKEATSSCAARLVDVDGPVIEKLVAENSYYSWMVIPGGIYRGSDTDTLTFGVTATFVASARVTDEAVYQLVKTVFESFDDFRKQHPALRGLKKKSMVIDGRAVPLHPGAIRYYKEVGLL